MENKINFTARPKAIIKALEDAPICPCKKKFIGSVANYFDQLETQIKMIKDTPDTFTYHLDKSNEISSEIKKLSVNGLTLAELDKTLTSSSFTCGGKNCGIPESKSSFIHKMLTMIGVEKPNLIELNK